MKKMILSVLLLMILIPNVVMAEENTCEQINTSSEKTIDINITQIIINKENIGNKDLSKFKFNYKILDLENNVLSKTTNDINGNITFSCFDVKSSDIGEYKLYKIVMEDNENIPFDYDPNIIYFSLRPNTTNGLFDPIVAFYKDDGNDSPTRYNTTYKGKVFHATEEELQGKAYAVIDRSTGVMTFFRDEPGKYTNMQDDGNKKYYTGFEEHQNKNWYSAWSGGWRSDYEIRSYIKKIVFKDAIKPNNITGWFEALPELEELNVEKLDTSLLTGIDYFLLDCPKVKSVDISTFDASNVNSMFKSFNKTAVEYLDFTALNLNQALSRMQISEFVLENNNLKYLNISNFGNWSSSGEITNLTCLEKIIINDIYDFSRGNIDGWGPKIWYNPKKNRVFTDNEIKNILYNHSESMAGYYIRPVCTKGASFISRYNSSKIKNSNSKSNIFENPNTGTRIIIIIFMLIISSITYITIKVKKNYFK